MRHPPYRGRMGELRAYAVDLGRLRALLAGGPAERDRVAALVRPVLAPPPAPVPWGPLFRRVPGTPVLREDDPDAADLDRLLGGEPVPAGRVPAAWRLLEAVVAGLATSSTRTAAPRPDDLRPLGAGAPLPSSPGHVAGVWSRTPTPGALGDWAAGLSPDADVVVFWSGHPTR